MELLKDTIWNIIQKIAEAYREQDVLQQGRKKQIQSAHSAAKEKKQILETKIENCRLCRIELYDQWKEEVLSREEYIRKKEEASAREAGYRGELEQLNQVIQNLVSEQEALEQTDGMAVLLGTESLTKELVDELIERVEVYAEDRVEIKWKIAYFAEE